MDGAPLVLSVLLGVFVVIDVVYLVFRGKSGAVFVLARDRRDQRAVVVRRERERS